MEVHSMQELAVLPIAHRNLVWHAKLDQKYTCQVRSIEANRYQGLLTIHDDSGKLLHSQPVEVSYGAVFGPDTLDVTNWQRMAAHFIDSLAKEPRWK